MRECTICGYEINGKPHSVSQCLENQTKNKEFWHSLWITADAERTMLQEKLATAIRWLRRLELEHPGSLNEDAIKKHLE